MTKGERRQQRKAARARGEAVVIYATPYDWLVQAAQEWDEVRLYKELCALAARLDSDTLQDEYQSEMSNDGYFD